MNPFTAGGGHNIDIADYWMILKKRSFQVVLVFLLVVGGVLMHTVNISPVYQSTCKIKISSRQPMATIEGAQITWYGSKGNEISSEIKLLANKDSIIEKVLEILRDPAGFDPGPDSRYFEDKLEQIRAINLEGDRKLVQGLGMNGLKGAISVEQIPQSDIVEINASGPSRNLARAIADILAIAYRADFWKSKTTEAAETKSFIDERVQAIRDDLEKARSEVGESSTKKAYLGSEQVYRENLTALRVEYIKLQEKYQENHPRLLRQRKIIRTIEDKLNAIPVVQQKYDESASELELKRNILATLNELKMKADIDFQAKLQKAKDEIQIISSAGPARKVRPDFQMNLIAGALFGIILGGIVAFVWEGLDTSIGKIEDVERITGLSVIAHIPLIGSDNDPQSHNFRPLASLRKYFFRLFYGFVPMKKKEPPLDLDQKILMNFDTLSVTAEAYRTLRTNIQFAIGAASTSGNVIAVTSTSPREGKTLTSTNLSIALAQMGKSTLLLEGDMRRPQIANLFKIDETPGLSDMLIGTAKRDTAIRTFTDVLMGDSEWDKLIDTQGIDNLHLLPCGNIPPNPSELLLSPEFRELIRELRGDYDFVIIDTPPALPVSDSSIIGTSVDGTLLIYQSDTTSRHLLLRAIQMLQKNEAKLLGIVINQLAFDVSIKGGRGKYYNYNYRYDQA